MTLDLFGIIIFLNINIFISALGDFFMVMINWLQPNTRTIACPMTMNIVTANLVWTFHPFSPYLVGPMLQVLWCIQFSAYERWIEGIWQRCNIENPILKISVYIWWVSAIQPAKWCLSTEMLLSCLRSIRSREV